MNKAIKIISNTLFVINAFILFSCFTHLVSFTILSLTVLVLLALNLVQLKKRDSILKNNKYNLMFLFVNIVTLVIFLRDRFDPTLLLGSYYDINIFSGNTTGGMFIDYNLPFITIMYTGILLYNLLNKEWTKKNKKI
jgi:hypothetical protein